MWLEFCGWWAGKVAWRYASHQISTQSHTGTLSVPPPPVSVVGSTWEMERTGLAGDAGKVKEPDGKLGWGWRGGSARKTRNPEKAECEELPSLLPQGLLLRLPWGSFPTPASRMRASLFPGEATQKEVFPSSCVPEPSSYSLLSTFSSAIFPPWAPPNG